MSKVELVRHGRYAPCCAACADRCMVPGRATWQCRCPRTKSDKSSRLGARWLSGKRDLDREVEVSAKFQKVAAVRSMSSPAGPPGSSFMRACRQAARARLNFSAWHHVARPGLGCGARSVLQRDAQRSHRQLALAQAPRDALCSEVASLSWRASRSTMSVSRAAINMLDAGEVRKRRQMGRTAMTLIFANEGSSMAVCACSPQRAQRSRSCTSSDQ